MFRTSLALASIVLLGSACIGEPQVANVTLSTSTVTLDAIGATATLSASVTDQDGAALTNEVSWTSSAAGVATVSSAGLVTAVANGSATITATAGGVSSNASVTVAQVATSMSKTAGDAQTGVVGAALATQLGVEARDRLNQPVAGAAVGFAVTAGGGAVSAATATTSATGAATVGWTLGTVAGDPQTVRASVGTVTADFSATATPGAPDSLALVAGAGQSGLPSSTLPDSLRVRVADAFGNDVPGATVDWAVTGGGGAVSPVQNVTDAGGEAATQWTLGASLGTQTATATVAGATVGSPAQATADAVAGTLAINEGDGQIGLVGVPANYAPSVVVMAGMTPVPGVTVTFSVASGGGSITDSVQVTDAEGVARVGSWTLGATPGANSLMVDAGGSIGNSPLTIDATGEAASYSIELRFINGTTPTAGQQAAFDAAVATWESIIFRDLADIAVNLPAGACITGQPATNETVDDLLIFVDFAPIDGASATLAQAGHCDFAPPTPPFRAATDSLPVIGIMIIDDADIGNMETNGSLTAVIMHEMGHVLGFNSGIFTNKGRLRNPSLTGGAGVDTHFDGTQAIASMNRNGGNSYAASAKVPIQNTAIQGQADSHWRESVFDTELMTPFTDATMPLSEVTIAAFADIAYGVTFSAADAFDLGFGISTGPRIKVLLVNDVIFRSLNGTGATGRMVR